MTNCSVFFVGIKTTMDLFIVMLVMAILGSALGEGVLNHGASECPKLRKYTIDKIIVKGDECVEMGATPTTGHELKNAKGIEDYRRFFVGYCQRESIVRDCLAEEATKFQVCQNETNFVNLFNVFQIYRGILETLLDIECKSGDSSRLATFWHGVHIAARDGYRKGSVVRKAGECFDRFLTLLGEFESSDVDNPSKSYVIYKEFPIFKQCVYQIEMEPHFKEVLHIFLTEIINRIKCINPKDGNFVLCDTIDVSLISHASYCDVKTNNNEHSMYDILESESISGFDILVSYGEDAYLSTDTLDIDLRSFYRRICDVSDVDVTCPELPTTYSILCMNETQQHELKGLCETIQEAANGLCIESGKHLAEIIIKVYRLKNTTSKKDNVIYQCVDSVKSARKTNTMIGQSSKNRFYHELETFKECLVNMFHGDLLVIDAVMSIYNNVRGKLKCVKPEDGTTVLCKDITH